MFYAMPDFTLMRQGSSPLPFLSSRSYVTKNTFEPAIHGCVWLGKYTPFRTERARRIHNIWALGTGVARTLRIADMREVVGSIPTVSTFCPFVRYISILG